MQRFGLTLTGTRSHFVPRSGVNASIHGEMLTKQRMYIDILQSNPFFVTRLFQQFCVIFLSSENVHSILKFNTYSTFPLCFPFLWQLSFTTYCKSCSIIAWLLVYPLLLYTYQMIYTKKHSLANRRSLDWRYLTDQNKCHPLRKDKFTKSLQTTCGPRHAP